MLTNLTDVVGFAIGPSESAAGRQAQLESRNNKAVDQVSEPQSEQVKLKAEVLI